MDLGLRGFGLRVWGQGLTILETPPWGDKEVREFIYDFVVTFKGQIRDKDVRGTKAFLKISQRIFWGLKGSFDL